MFSGCCKIFETCLYHVLKDLDLDDPVFETCLDDPVSWKPVCKIESLDHVLKDFTKSMMSNFIEPVSKCR